MAAQLAQDILDSDELFALIRLHLDKGDIESALLKTKMLLQRKDRPDESLAVAARIYAQLRLFAKAGDCYRQYLKARPDALLERFQLGMTCFDQQRYDEALAVWDEVLRRHPGHPPASFYQALVLSQQGKAAQAIELLNELLKTLKADNLYFERARELLASLQQDDVAHSKDAAGSKKPGISVMPEDAYKTEH